MSLEFGANIAVLEKQRMHQLWLRLTSAIGMLWGFLPMVSLPFVSRGRTDTAFDIAAVVVYSLTLFPSALLALWFRRPACIWLTVCSTLLLVSVVTHAGSYGTRSLIGVAVAVAVTIVMDTAELSHWPGALEKL